MNPQQFQQLDRRHITVGRNFRCPCGLTYLSYPALYTHIKNKHEGKAPGQIQKPKIQSRRRGRPPLGRRVQSSQGTKVNEESIDQINDNTYKQDFEVIKDCLKQININQYINPQIYMQQGQDQQNCTIKLFQKFIDDHSADVKGQSQELSIGSGLAKFFGAVDQLLQTKQKTKSQQVFLLFILLLQYTIDITNDKSILSTLPVQSLIEYINPFMNQWIIDFAEHKNISNLWIMKKNNMTKIFHCFYSWLKLNQYTSFCITLLW